MQMHDVRQFMMILAGIGELYGKTMTAALTDIYWQALKTFELQDVQQAFQAHIHNPDCGQFFPKPADIMRVIQSGGETQEFQAWTKVGRAILQVRVYQSLVFDDLLIHTVLEDMRGWIKLCSFTYEGLPFYANEFRKRYVGFVFKKPERHFKYLYGLFLLGNTKNGYEIKAPLLVGEYEKAKQMVSTGGERLGLIQSLNVSFMETIKALSYSHKEKNMDSS